jgi:hypothetical protein
MGPYRQITTKESGWYEICARHTARQTTRMLQTAYFCDPCAEKLVAEAFNNRPPVYHGQTLQGFCGLCNKMRDVTMRQWFVCGTCWNVVLAYQKSIAASEAILAWWDREIKPRFANLALSETEPVYLSAYARSAATKKQRALTLSVLDFLVSDAAATPLLPLFHIEQKTGPGSIEEMTEFQLDVNDFNDIVGATNTTRLPSYIVHVQAAQDYALPTRKTVIIGMWWTDIFKLQAHQKRIALRRNEDKKAVYYAPSAFSAIDTFADELLVSGYKQLAATLSREPIVPIH